VIINSVKYRIFSDVIIGLIIWTLIWSYYSTVDWCRLLIPDNRSISSVYLKTVFDFINFLLEQQSTGFFHLIVLLLFLFTPNWYLRTCTPRNPLLVGKNRIKFVVFSVLAIIFSLKCPLSLESLELAAGRKTTTNRHDDWLVKISIMDLHIRALKYRLLLCSIKIFVEFRGKERWETAMTLRKV